MTARVDQNAIRHIAKLANLSLSPEEVRSYEDQLDRILGHIDQIAEVVNTTTGKSLSGFEPAREREDTVSPSLPAETALAQAPARIGTAFQVPRIIDTEG